LFGKRTNMTIAATITITIFFMWVPLSQIKQKGRVHQRLNLWLLGLSICLSNTLPPLVKDAQILFK